MRIYRISSIYDKCSVMGFYNPSYNVFPRILSFLDAFSSLSARLFWTFFSFQWMIRNDILTLFWWPFPAVLDPTVSRKSWGLICSYKMNLWSCIPRWISCYLSFVSFCLFLYIIGPNYFKRKKRLLFIHSKPKEIGSAKLASPDTETFI